MNILQKVAPYLGRHNFGPFLGRPQYLSSKAGSPIESLSYHQYQENVKGASAFKTAPNVGVEDEKKKVEANVDASVVAVKKTKEASVPFSSSPGKSVSDQASPCAGVGRNKEADINTVVDTGVMAAKNARTGPQNVGYRETTIWQESMMKLGAKAARDTHDELAAYENGNVLSAGATAAQRAAFEQGRKDARGSSQ